MWCEGEVPLLFTENETNMERLFHQANRSPYVKDGINQYLVHGQQGAVNPLQTGTKAAAHYHVRVNGGKASVTGCVSALRLPRRTSAVRATYRSVNDSTRS